MKLKDLNQLGLNAQRLYSEYDKEEIELSNDFKKVFNQAISEQEKAVAHFSETTTIILSPNNLTITLPNQWFYIASYFVEFLIALKEYKSIYNATIKTLKTYKEVTKEIKATGKIDESTQSLISSALKDDNDISYFKSFLSDYSWWFGSKTIDRTDYYVSPVLGLAKVINVSQSYIADITNIFAENPNLYNLLKDSHISNKKPIAISTEEKLNEVISLKEQFVNWFIKNNGKNSNYYSDYFKGSKDDFSNALSEYGRIYNRTFDHSLFEYSDAKKQIELLSANLYLPNTEFSTFSKSKSNHMPRAILGNKNYIRFLNETLAENHFEKFLTSSFLQKLNQAGLIFNPKLVTRFISSLLTKPFVLLSGLSGSGKTKLAQAFALWLCKDESQYGIVSVGADWTNRESLLGYPNALEKKTYILPENGALELIINAIKNPKLPYFLILDEMNLSHVERYFADFLSVMESKENITLYAGEERTNVPHSLKLPPNLFIIGTVNIDETTYMFSPKVLDRANAIEFRINKEDLETFFSNNLDVNLETLESQGQFMAHNFIELAANKDFPEQDLTDTYSTLLKFFNQLKKTGAEFGYRSASEILRLINQLTVIDAQLSIDEKLDIAIMQKLLPKLHGSRRKLCPILKTLASFCLIENKIQDIEKEVLNVEDFDFQNTGTIKYPISLEKITRMYKGAIDNGFASYAEA